jgi:conjugative relaxase-like TrwC/TraI family protein
VLNLHRLAPGAEAYYLDQVVSGLEDYYAEAGEAPGYWLASSHDLLGLEGRLDSEDLRAVLTGHDPSSGESLHAARNRKVPGWDLTFRAPKSVSILWGLSEPDVAHHVLAAHEAAVARAMAYMEDVAAWTRTGRNGVERVRAGGFIAAAFQHRTSRDRDPLLHTHVLVANSVRSADGKWRTIDATALYDHARTGGYLYQAELRHQLTRRLDVDWEPVSNGVADIVGVDDELIALFSKRRERIEATMAEWGVSSAKAAQAATLDSRRTKDDRGETHGEQAPRWRNEVVTAGLDLAELALVRSDHRPLPAVDADETTLIFDRLSSVSGLTRSHSTFDRRDVLRALIDDLPGGVPVRTIEALADEYLDQPEVVHVGARSRTGPTYSTADLIALEQQLVDLVAGDVRGGRCRTTYTAAQKAASARPTLGSDQADVIQMLCARGLAVDVLIAPAGTGKTFSLDAAREAWQESAFEVKGVALSAAAAHELESGSGIPSMTITRFQHQIESAMQRLDDRLVLVIDEAGMVGTRTLAPLVSRVVDAGGKVVLVGDPRQLPEITAGGLLRAMEGNELVLTLSENRRHADETERRALHELRSGDPRRALAILRDHGSVVSGRNSEVVRDGMAVDWFRHRQAGDEALMMAKRNVDVDDLNRRARRLVAEAGVLSGDTLIVSDRPFQIGDEVVCLRNDYPNSVRNGTFGTITRVDVDRRGVTIETDDGRRTLGADYLDSGWMRHGYAVTIHKAQGRTCDHGLLLGGDDIHREMGYVGLSRGRQSNRLYAVSTELADDLTHHGREERYDPYESLADALSRSEGKTLAIEAGIGVDDGFDIGW